MKNSPETSRAYPRQMTDNEQSPNLSFGLNPSSPSRGCTMDFEFSEDQRLLKESVDGFLGTYYRFEDRRSYAAEEPGWSRRFWKNLADQGLLALPFSEDDGGAGAGEVETMVVMEAFGKALIVEPYLSTIVLGGGLLRRAGSAQQRQAYLPKLIDGSLTMTLALSEEQFGSDLHDVTSTATKTSSGWRISGRKLAVQDGSSADIFAVTARTAGRRRDRQGLGVFLVPADTTGVEINAYSLQDGRKAADITFHNVDIAADMLIGDPSDGQRLVEAVVDDGIAALCAEAVGCMDAALATTVEYLKTRRQFGAAIGSFQAVQHRSADMFVALEQARSMAYFATMATSFEDAGERSAAISSAKVQIGRSSRFIGQQAVQLHGGVGMAMENCIGHYFKRLTMIDLLFGSSEHHLRALANRDLARV